MPPRSVIQTQLPAELREELNARLVAGGFSDYEKLTEWLNDRLAALGSGLSVSLSSVHRHGKQFQEQFQAEMAETRQLYQLAKVSAADSADPEGVVREATIRTLQTRLLKLSVALREAEEAGDDVHKLAETSTKIARAVADLGRADIAGRKWQAEREKSIREDERQASEKAATTAASKAGVSKEGIAAIRAAIMERL